MGRLLLCCDLDRTVIPNGDQPEHPGAREHFSALCALPELSLVYVSGRHLQLVQQAIENYNLPAPDYVISDVGTRIYRRFEGECDEVLSWNKRISGDWHGKTHGQLLQALSRFPELQPQEQSKQNDFKLSYYLALDEDREKILKTVAECLIQLGVEASLIWSIDEPEQIGLLDILPRNATKLHAIKFLQQRLGYGPDEVIFAGDSGNDLPVLASPIRSVLVANAEADIRQQAQQLAERNGCSDALYLAREDNFPLGGNYSAGILQGVAFFAPEIGKKLNLL